jgi:alpha-glucosidase (family GH31 glycosyl hydrolase)
MPYIYSCAYEAAVEGTPIERSLHLEFPDDLGLKCDTVHSLFGPSLLKVLVTEKGCHEAHVHLPKGLWWYDKTGMAIEGGCDLTVPYPCNGEMVWFAKEGSAIPTAPHLTHLGTAFFEQVEFLVFPVRTTGKEVVSTYFEDDGKTELHKQNCNLWSLKVTENQVVVSKTKAAHDEPAGRLFTLRVGTRKFEFNPASLKRGESISFAF